jgi:tetratricopeptide (TPR) repeat protein
MTTWLLLLGLCTGADAPVGETLNPAGAQEKLRQARANFDYRNYGPAADLAQEVIDSRALERTPDQIETYRILGLSRFFQGRTEEARIAFINLLSLDPDFQLDPFYVPPQAVAFFERVRADNQALLQPIRERRREALRQEEEARARLLNQGQAQPQIIREQVTRPSAAVALLPFGVGQFQNGDTTLGVTFAVTEAIAAVASVSCYVWVESQRSSTGYFPSSVYSTAVTVRDVQIATGIAFFVLWAGGAVEAVLNLKPPTVVRVPESPGTEAKPGLHAAIAPTPSGARGILAFDF